MPTLAGPEIGVASTKAFTCQLAVLACLAVAAGRARGVLSEEEEREMVRALIETPRLMAEALALEPQVEQIARDLAKRRNVLYLGAGSDRSSGSCSSVSRPCLPQMVMSNYRPPAQASGRTIYCLCVSFMPDSDAWGANPVSAQQDRLESYSRHGSIRRKRKVKIYSLTSDPSEKARGSDDAAVCSAGFSTPNASSHEFTPRIDALRTNPSLAPQ
jgi:hypothetical protein